MQVWPAFFGWLGITHTLAHYSFFHVFSFSKSNPWALPPAAQIHTVLVFKSPPFICIYYSRKWCRGCLREQWEQDGAMGLFHQVITAQTIPHWAGSHPTGAKQGRQSSVSEMSWVLWRGRNAWWVTNPSHAGHFKLCGFLFATSEKKLITDALNKNQFLKRLEPHQTRDMVECMYERTFQQGSYVIRQGEPGNHIFVLKGEYCLLVHLTGARNSKGI